MKSNTKIIEHKKCTASGGGHRKYVQEDVPPHAHHTPAHRYISRLGIHGFPSLGDHDALVTLLLEAGKSEPSYMAKKKFYAHRPRPADNSVKNRARRHSMTLVLGTSGPGAKPAAPAIRINAAQVRAMQGMPGMDPRTVRSITRDRNHSGSQWMSRNSARECRRRRKQMGTGEYAKAT